MPVQHADNLPVPSRTRGQIPSDSEISSTQEITDDDSLYHCTSESSPHLLTQADLNDLVSDLELSKQKAQLFGSRLQEYNLLHQSTKISVFRHREHAFISYFSTDEALTFCNDVAGLMKVLNFTYISQEWRLFIDASKTSLKGFLLHNGNKIPSVPVAYASLTKENYEFVQRMLNSLKYNEHKWKICADFKVIAMVLGMQRSYTKYACFLCEWDTRDRNSHYVKKKWPRRRWKVGEKNVQRESLVAPDYILLPPLHIQLGLMKQLVKTMDPTGWGFAYLATKFPRLSAAKIKEGVFVGPQIRELQKDANFEACLTDKEKTAWDCFKMVLENFLRGRRATNYKAMVKDMIKAYQDLGCNMSLKVHMMDSHLDYFTESCSDVSDEHGERFHKDISTIERRYEGKWVPSMLADYCWNIIREKKDSQYERKK
ncbi:uncharacterized protein LOC126235714 [Schistocerca nitens]|uniref:uncharacterized protein LOC126235714 n=1 Tax=Schistocerca nitens TaxID=7011 RepID=UPI002117D0BE|nr:uncharacterized protein LOC126235714 [Schistocerca nitens]